MHTLTLRVKPISTFSLHKIIIKIIYLVNRIRRYKMHGKAHRNKKLAEHEEDLFLQMAHFPTKYQRALNATRDGMNSL